ncbi:hypothetical protein J6590_065980 [Homalodisca vitripennis]|nr:hypothetical protein J6590_065980 [Homalodisca vitripennis]
MCCTQARTDSTTETRVRQTDDEELLTPPNSDVVLAENVHCFEDTFLEGKKHVLSRKYNIQGRIKVDLRGAPTLLGHVQYLDPWLHVYKCVDTRRSILRQS